ncbi:hypothetical protein BC835DRAFT_1347587 [Cytidiella melzeri]|nr:hypothetical protein BC835DRAFT_1347587 [Cytidiella melzeri]
MMDTLQHSRVPGTEYVRFALTVIGHRLQDHIVIPSSGFLDLLRLPKQTASTIMFSIVKILRNEIKRQLLASDRVDWHDWMQDCLSLLFAKTNAPILTEANLLLSSLLTNQFRRTTFFNIIKIRASDTNAVPHILETLQGTLVLMDGTDALLVLYHLVQQYFSPESAITYEAVLDTLKNTAKVPHDCLHLLVDTLVSLVGKELSEPKWSSYTLDKLTLIMELWFRISRRDGVLNLFKYLLSTKTCFAGTSKYALGLKVDPESSNLKEGAQSMFIDVILAASPSSELPTILKNLREVLEAQWKQRSGPEHRSDSLYEGQWLDPLKSCHVLLRSLCAMREHGSPIDDHRDLLWNIWGAVCQALPVARRHIGCQSDIAKDCLKLIDSLDISQPPDGEDTPAYRSWVQTFAESASLFPDTLIKGLMSFLASDEDTTFSHRARRLAIIEEKAKEDESSSTGGSVNTWLYDVQDMVYYISEEQDVLESARSSQHAPEDRTASPRNSVHVLQVEVIDEDSSSSVSARSDTLPPGFPDCLDLP